MYIYLICPVRNATFDSSEIVKALEADGHKVHFPPRDVDQTDTTGFFICDSHLKAMMEADEVHIVWDQESKGSHFDLGMAFALGKPITLIKSLHDDPPGKSYLKVIQMVDYKNLL